MARKLEITENEKYILQEVKYDEKTEKDGKLRNVHCRMWNMARNLKKVENLEMSTVGRAIWQEN